MDYHCCFTEGKDMKNPRNLQGFRGKVLRDAKITIRPLSVTLQCGEQLCNYNKPFS